MNKKIPAMLAVLVASMTAAPGASYAVVDEHLEFAVNIEFIKGHLMQAVANKQADDIPLAKAHATHPVSELYMLIEGEVEEYDEELNSSLRTALDELPAKVNQLSADEFVGEVDRIEAMLEGAMEVVVPQEKQDNHVFWIRVVIELLEEAEHEYEEGVSGGEVREMVEYQDAQGFAARANVVFNNVAGKIDEHEREEIEEFFADLANAMASVHDPEHVETIIGGIVHELREVAEIGEVEITAETTSQQYIENIRQLLKQVSAEYKNGNSAGADKLAVVAYLENFEYVEADLEERGAEELMEEIEDMMRVELREMIKNDVPQDELDSHISLIDAKLAEAYAVVPEFPLGLTIALASLVGVMVAVTRTRIFGLRH